MVNYFMRCLVLNILLPVVEFNRRLHEAFITSWFEYITGTCDWVQVDEDLQAHHVGVYYSNKGFITQLWVLNLSVCSRNLIPLLIGMGHRGVVIVRFLTSSECIGTFAVVLFQFVCNLLSETLSSSHVGGRVLSNLQLEVH